MILTDISCFLAAIIGLFGPLALLVLWHKKTGARFYPAMIALPVCFPVFVTGAVIRSGFSQENLLRYFILQALLYGILEEGAKFLMLRFFLTEYDSPKDAASYGIGHTAYESFGAGIRCFGLIGTGNAAADILPMGIWSLIEGTASTVGVTVLILYGIRTDKSKIMLPAAILLHTAGNFTGALASFSGAAAVLRILLTAGTCFAAYRCRKAMEDPFSS